MTSFQHCMPCRLSIFCKCFHETKEILDDVVASRVVGYKCRLDLQSENSKKNAQREKINLNKEPIAIYTNPS